MTEQESKDLEVLKAKQVDRKLSTYDYMRAILRYNETDLKHSGYSGKTIAQALESVMRNAEKDIEKLHKEYIKKYPD